MTTTKKQYDIIGDIHGHGNKLIKLLEKLGYQDSGSGYQHPSNIAIFVGDFVDRGEDLAEHDLLMTTVMDMVNNNHALAIMGNHEFNALAYHTEHDGKPLRPHTAKNQSQHQAFLNEFEHRPDRKSEILDFFWSLPLFLEIDDFRVVHACWSDEYVDFIKNTTSNNRLTKDLLVEASIEGTKAYDAIETLLKGIEIQLPNGVTFLDKDKNERDAVRIQWWKSEAKQLKEVALPLSLDLGETGNIEIPNISYQYAETAPPCFIGHYWLHGEPSPLSHNVACLDYSIAKGGKLMAYRWDGSSTLNRSNFHYV